MPSIILAIIGFVGGWCLCTGLAQGLVQEKPSNEKPEARLKEEAWLRTGLGTIALGFAGLVFLILLLEAKGRSSAFDFEEFWIQPRVSLFGAFFALGFACRAFKDQVFFGVETLLDIALVMPSAAKQETPKRAARRGAPKPDEDDGKPTARFSDRNLPWSVQAGLFVGLVIILVLAFNPQIFRNMTSFKAGGFEVHFTSSTQWEIQAGQIALVDIDRKTMLKYLSGLDFKNELIWQDNDKESKLNRWRLKFAKSFIAQRLSPMFSYLYCMESKNIALSPVQKAATSLFAIDILNHLAADLSKPKLPTIEEQLTQLQAIADPDVLATSPSPKKDALGQICNPNSNEPQKRSDPATKDSLIDLLPAKAFDAAEKSEVAQSQALIWDPYLIRAVADLATYAGESRHAESLIEAAVEDGDYVNGLPDIERLSLWRAHLTAVVRSERPWPFDDTFDRMSKLLNESKRHLDENPPNPQGKDDGPETANTYYRKTRLSDLTLGLQLFYQRALLKQRFTALQLERWGEWLKELRTTLDILGTSYSERQNTGGSEKKASNSASNAIRKNRAAVQKAVTVAALSAVLLPAQKGTPDSGDCLSAAKLLNAARSDLDTFFSYNGSLPDEKETYKGWLEQVGTLISNSCN